MSFTLSLAVRDLNRTAEFYRDVLEMPLERLVPASGQAPLLFLPWGEAAILFREQDDLEAAHPALFQGLDRRPRGIGMTLEFVVPRLAPLLRNIRRRGLHLRYELEDEEFRRREVWLHDPDGYLIILSEPLKVASLPTPRLPGT